MGKTQSFWVVIFGLGLGIGCGTPISPSSPGKNPVWIPQSNGGESTTGSMTDTLTFERPQEFPFSLQVSNSRPLPTDILGRSTGTYAEGSEGLIYTTPAISTDGTLRVTLRAAPARKFNGDTINQVNYSCIQVSVTVGEITRTMRAPQFTGKPGFTLPDRGQHFDKIFNWTKSPCAQDLSVEPGCRMNADFSQTCDFTPGDRNQSDLYVSVENPSFDSCYPYGNEIFQRFGVSAYQFVGCPMVKPLSNHIVSGRLEVFTSTTSVH